MTTSISDRIATMQGSSNRRVETGETVNMARAIGESGEAVEDVSALNAELCQLIRSKRKIGEGVVVGTTRLDHWNNFSQNTFIRFATLLRTALELQNPLTVVPWKLTGDQSVIGEILSLGAHETRLDPSLISRLLRELPVWKKQCPFVLLDLGRINSEVAQSLAPWCDVTLVLSHPAASPRPQDSRAIRQWHGRGLPLSAAVHVA